RGLGDVYKRQVLTGPFIIPSTLLREGTNTLAAEVHQYSSTSADIVFAIRLDAVITVTNIIDTSPSLFINEILASNRSITNSAGRRSDYVELINLADHDIDLGGWSITDDPTNPRRYVFPTGIVLHPNQLYVIECEASVPQSATNTGFDLSANGGALFLFRPSDPSVPADTVRFGLQVPDLSIGRTAPGGSSWTLNRPTPGTQNAALLTGNPFVLRINEWMADPSSGDDWFEIYNPGPDPIDLSGLCLTDNFADRTRHRIPPLSFIGSGTAAYLKFVADGNAGRGANHVNFKLAASGEEIGLFTESGVTIDAVSFGPQSPGVSEGRCPDGYGPIVKLEHGPSPGTSNCSSNEPDSDSDGIPDSWERAHGLNPFDPSDAQTDPDADRLTNLEEYLAGTSPHDKYSALRFTSIWVENDTVHIRFQAVAGRTYTIEAVEIPGYNTWAIISEVPPLAQDSEIEVVDSLKTTRGKLYRLKLRVK
ncbi:MAG: lamin tail domain-containing protein, partial [Verrucomicrobiae bacterium]|nr:lamin tail domain-containing protein [Verrucomicrobiae bacterium]